MPEGGQQDIGDSFRAFWITLLLLDLGLIIAGAVYASEHSIPAGTAVPIVAAFVLQSSLFVAPGFPQVRHWLERRFSPPRLSWMLFGASLAHYLIYAVPCGVFAWSGFVSLAGLCLVIAFLFVGAPPRSDALSWQDGIVMAALAYPMVSGLGSPLESIYPSPHPEVPNLDSLGKIMVISLGLMAFLSLRRLPRTGFRFAISRDDFLAGLRNFLLFLVPAAVLSITIGFVRWGPAPVDSWTYPLVVAANAIGIYLRVALAEEMFFRGVLQNLLTARLGRPQAALVISSILFGLSHLGRDFPNWRYTLVTILLGWFCGRAYAQRQSVVAAAVTHSLAVLVRRYLFL